MASQHDVVHILDDDDDDDDDGGGGVGSGGFAVTTAAASASSSRKRSRTAATETSSPPSSPSLSERLLEALSSADADNRSTPKRRPATSAAEPHILVNEDGPGIVVAENPGSSSPRSGPGPAPRGLSSVAPAGRSSVISLEDSDDVWDDDDATFPTSAADQDVGTTSYGQPGADVCAEGSSSQEVNEQRKEENQKKKQKGKRLTKERDKQTEERKQQRLENKKQKEAIAEKKKKEIEIQKWESGKLALKCITVEIDHNVAESGSIGGTLFSSLLEKDLSYKLTKNLVPRSILWKMKVPDDIAQALSDLNDGCDMNQSSAPEVPYIVIVLQAEEFCDLVSSGSFFHHVQEVCEKYPTFTICYVTNKLMYHINKLDQIKFKDRTKTWNRPPVEEVLCKLATHYANVHSRQCINEAEVAEHLTGLTCSLAQCKFRKPLTWLSVHANGLIVPDSFIDKALAKKNTWVKSLIAIPGVHPKNAIAIWKKYPSMRSLLNVYMDRYKTVDEKELLLSEFKWEGRLGNEGKRLSPKCSRRVYRILMAENGDLGTDTPEAGA